jgi:hypothetical protein
VPAPPRPPDREPATSVIGALALAVAALVALLGEWSARPDEPARSGTRMRIGVFERSRLDAGVGRELANALAAVGADERLAWIGERSIASEWSADGVEVVDVTDALRTKLALPAGGAK